MEKGLKDLIFEAEKSGKAIGHFNIANLELLNGVLGAVRAVGEPAIVGTTEGEREFIGTSFAVSLVRKAREEGMPLFINADHHHSFEAFKEAVNAGYDMAIIDGAGLPFDENVAMTKKSVEYARANNPEMLVEGELGYIGTSSQILDEIPEGAQITDELMTKPEEAKKFVEETGVDLLAPAVGNLHGMLRNMPNPSLNIERIREIREAVGIPLVLHGGSGSSDEDFIAAIKAGMSIVHISTEIRIAYRKALEVSLDQNPDALAPYKYLPPAVEAVKDLVSKRMRLFSGK